MSYRHGRMDGPAVLVLAVVWLLKVLVWRPLRWVWRLLVRKRM